MLHNYLSITVHITLYYNSFGYLSFFSPSSKTSAMTALHLSLQPQGLAKCLHIVDTWISVETLTGVVNSERQSLNNVGYSQTFILSVLLLGSKIGERNQETISRFKNCTPFSKSMGKFGVYKILLFILWLCLQRIWDIRNTITTFLLLLIPSYYHHHYIYN